MRTESECVLIKKERAKLKMNPAYIPESRFLIPTTGI
jgi:hypothetical protein